jgi:hypothetical protein
MIGVDPDNAKQALSWEACGRAASAGLTKAALSSISLPRSANFLPPRQLSLLARPTQTLGRTEGYINSICLTGGL